MSLKSSYFAIPNPFALLARTLNPARHHATLTLRGRPLTVNWTRRAARQLARRETPLLAEMQLYFSCVVKKRVVFHPQQGSSALEWVTVMPQLRIAFRAVESNSCDPLEFAANFPLRRELDSSGARKMHPAQLHLDFKGDGWYGEFSI